MNTVNHKIIAVLSALAFFSAVCTTSFANQTSPRNYIIVAGPGLPKDQAVELLKQSFVLLLERAAPGDRVELIAAPKMAKLADVVVPAGSMRSRANSQEFAGKFGRWKAFLSETNILEPRQVGQLALPQLVDEIARSREPGQPTIIILCGTPVFMSSRATEEAFDMAGGLVPSDGAILAPSSQSIYGTADRKTELNGVFVDWFIPDDKWVLSQAHSKAVLRAWSGFFHELGANLSSCSSDCDTVFDRAINGESTPAMVASLKSQDRTVRMERVPSFRLEQAMEKTPVTVEVASDVPSQNVQSTSPSPHPVVIKETPPAPPKPVLQKQTVTPKPVLPEFFDVTVLDRNNRPVASLDGKQFVLLEDGVPQKITFFKRERMPTSMTILVDTSGSMSSKFGRVRAAALSITHQGLPQDEFSILGFTDNMTVAQDFTTNTAVLEQALNHLSANGSTALLDAIKEAVERTNEKGKYDRKAICLITDGDENDSRCDRESVLATLKASNVQVFCVGFPDGLDADRLADSRGGHLVRKGQTESGAHDLLTQLANISGGRAFFPHQAMELEGIASSITLDLSTQYRLGYYSTSNNHDGHWRQVHVEINPSLNGNNGLTALTRSGYFAHE